VNAYENLVVWERAIRLVSNIYKLTDNFPYDEKYCLRSQMRRAVISIPSNIAEGAGRYTSKDFNNFLSYTSGSCCELETQLLIARNLKYINVKQYEDTKLKVLEIKKMIFRLYQSNKTKPGALNQTHNT
jgi:four helix bundle protein